VAALKDLQLPVDRAGTAPVADRALAIEGQFISRAAQGGVQAATVPQDTAEADAKRTAAELAKRVEQLFADRGWSSTRAE
jgi:hypothetical protein